MFPLQPSGKLTTKRDEKMPKGKSPRQQRGRRRPKRLGRRGRNNLPRTVRIVPPTNPFSTSSTLQRVVEWVGNADPTSAEELRIFADSFALATLNAFENDQGGVVDAYSPFTGFKVLVRALDHLEPLCVSLGFAAMRMSWSLNHSQMPQGRSILVAETLAMRT